MSDEFEYDDQFSNSTTVEELTLAQINQLQSAWQIERNESINSKRTIVKIQKEISALNKKLEETQNELDFEMIQSQLSNKFCMNPANPFALIRLFNKIISTGYLNSPSTLFESNSSFSFLDSFPITELPSPSLVAPYLLSGEIDWSVQ
jgi:hypothetical protein